VELDLESIERLMVRQDTLAAREAEIARAAHDGAFVIFETLDLDLPPVIDFVGLGHSRAWPSRPSDEPTPTSERADPVGAVALPEDGPVDVKSAVLGHVERGEIGNHVDGQVSVAGLGYVGRQSDSQD